MEEAVKSFLDNSFQTECSSREYPLIKDAENIYEDWSFSSGSEDCLPGYVIWKTTDGKYKVTLEYVGNEGPYVGRIRNETCESLKDVLKTLVKMKPFAGGPIVRMLVEMYPEHDCKHIIRNADALIDAIADDPDKQLTLAEIDTSGRLFNLDECRCHAHFSWKKLIG